MIECQKPPFRARWSPYSALIRVLCGYKKNVYRGIAKNLNRHYTLVYNEKLYANVHAD